MATSRHITSNRSAGSLPVAHNAVIIDFMEHTKHKICKACDISPGYYDMMHYDLAYAWFEYHRYLEFTARVFLLSKTYHRWWNQQLTQEEDQFLRQWGNQSIPSSLLHAALEETITEMEIQPSRELRRDMHNEGMSVIMNNPRLMSLKIYRNGRPGEGTARRDS
jgi:hypothetical protein